MDTTSYTDDREALAAARAYQAEQERGDSFAAPALGMLFLVGFGFLYLWLTGKKRKG